MRAFRVSKELAILHDAGAEGTRPASSTIESLYSTSAAVYACIRIRADAMARPPLRVYSGQKEVVSHPLVDLLQRVNPFWTRQQLVRAIETDLGWHGNAFVAVEQRKSKNALPFELWRMRPDWITIVPDSRNYIKGYIYNVGGQEYSWGVDEVIHWRYANPLNEYWGLSPLSAAKVAADLGIDALSYDRYFFSNLSAPAVALTTKEQIAKPHAEEILKRWEQTFKGVKQAGRTVVLHSGLEVHPIAMSQKDSEILGALKYTIDEIARVYRVPTPLIGEEKAVYKNISEAEVSFWHQAIIPELLWLEEILNAELVSLFRDPKLSIKFDLTDIESLQPDIDAKMARYAPLVDRGILTINEVRRRERLGPDHPWGDKWFAPMNLMPISKASADSTEQFNFPQTIKGVAEKRIPILSESITYEPKLLDTRTADDDMADKLGDILADFFAQEAEKIAEAYAMNIGVYATSSDYDWNRWRQVEGALAPLIAAYLLKAANSGFGEVAASETLNTAIIRAEQWAETRVAELITNVSDVTKASVRSVMKTGITEGWARDKLASEIRKSYVFTKDRATLIARTESQRAYNEGLIRGYRATGKVDKKTWSTMGVGDICEFCLMNEASDPIAMNAVFPTGHEAPPAHPNCRCRLMPFISGVSEITPV